MKIVLEATALMPPLTGIGRYTSALARLLPLQDEIEDVVLCYQGKIIDGVLLTEAPVLNALDDANPPTTKSWFKKLIRNDLTVASYRALVQARQYSRLLKYRDYIFHAPNFISPPFPGQSVVTIHDLSVFKYPEFHPLERVKHLQKAIPQAMHKAKLVITDSEYTRQELIDYFDWSPALVKAAPLGVDPVYRPRNIEELENVLVNFGLSAGNYCLTVSTIEPRKNLKRLLNAFSTLSEELRRKWPLVVVGHQGWSSEEVHKMLMTMQTTGSVIYLEYVPEKVLPALYAGAHAFLFPSLYEGFGLPVLEAMASGVPVMCSNRCSLPEVTQGAAFLVEAEDEEAIAEGIIKVLTDAPWRQLAIKRGRTVAEGYCWENTVKSMVSIYKSVLS